MTLVQPQNYRTLIIDSPICPKESSSTCEVIPAKIAVTPLPIEALIWKIQVEFGNTKSCRNAVPRTSEYVLDNHSSGNPCLRCSVVIQDSNAEKRRFVEMPPRTLPSNKRWKSAKCDRSPGQIEPQRLMRSHAQPILRYSTR